MKPKIIVHILILAVLGLWACAQASRAESEVDRTLNANQIQTEVELESEAIQDIEGTCIRNSDQMRLLINSIQGYCLQYPAEYDVAFLNANQVMFFKYSILNTPEPNFRVDVQPANGMTVEQAADKVEANYAIPGTEPARIELSIDGEKAIVLAGLSGQDPNRQVVVVHQDTLYTLFLMEMDRNQPEVVAQAETLYNTVIHSFNFHPESNLCPDCQPISDNEKTFVFKGVSLTYPSLLAEEATSNTISAFIDQSGFMYDDLPEHLRFDFSSTYTERAPFSNFQPGLAPWLKHQSPESLVLRPQIFIFPARDYADINPLAGERIESLRTLLDDNTLPAGGELPVLPTFNSAQDFHVQDKPLAFQGGRGLRFITRYSQEAAPVVNPAVFYTFQGLTDDGSLYVATFFPLYVSILPDQIQVEHWEAFNRGYQNYMADLTSRLESLNPDDFEPDLETFDNLIRSMTISPAPVTSTLNDSSSASATPTPEPQCFVTGFSPIAFMPDGDRILVREENGVQIFNLQTMQEEEFLAAPTSIYHPAVTLSPDGEVLAWGLEDFSIQVIRIADKKLLHTLTGHTDIIGKLSFSPKGDRLFSASHDTWVRIWDLEGNLVHAFQPTGALGFPNEVLGIGISPDGTMLATIPSDGPVKLWDLKDYKLVRELGGFGGFDTSDISFSPDGQLVASDTASGLFLWKTLDGTELLGGNPGINSMAMAFSPDGRFLAYGEIGEKFDVVLSSPDGAKRIRTLEGHPAPVGILFFSPDSSLLLSSDWVETRIWQVEDGQLLYIGKNACP